MVRAVTSLDFSGASLDRTSRPGAFGVDYDSTAAEVVQLRREVELDRIEGRSSTWLEQRLANREVDLAILEGLR